MGTWAASALMVPVQGIRLDAMTGKQEVGGILQKLSPGIRGVITIYGEGGSGKTMICLEACINVALQGKKIIYVDPQNNFSAERIKQIAPDGKARDILSKIIIVTPEGFEDQEKLFDRLRKGIREGVGLLVVDPISVFYRLEFAKKDKKAYLINRNLGVQLSYLNDISRKSNIPVFITAQVQASPETKQEASIVGGSVIDHMSGYVIEIRRIDNKRRQVVLKKPKGTGRKEVAFEILEKGISIL